MRTFIAASSIEGVGVFAAEPIPAGTVIWRFDQRFDRLVSEAEYEASPPFVKEFLDRYAYPSPDRPGFFVYETDNGRFMNHAERPNTDFTGFDGRALTDIAAGEELTCDYSEFYAEFQFEPAAERAAR